MKRAFIVAINLGKLILSEREFQQLTHDLKDVEDLERPFAEYAKRWFSEKFGSLDDGDCQPSAPLIEKGKLQ